MQAEPAESILKRVMAQYNERPQGWRVFADSRGNLLVLGPGVGYRLKLVPLNPREFVGVGVDIDPMEDLRLGTRLPFYGLRPLSGQQTSELFGAMRQNGQIGQDVLLRLLGAKPTSEWDLKEEGLAGVLTGPVVTHPDLSAVPAGQKELEERLSLEANRLFRAKYPFRAGIYG